MEDQSPICGYLIAKVPERDRHRTSVSQIHKRRHDCAQRERSEHSNFSSIRLTNTLAQPNQSPEACRDNVQCPPQEVKWNRRQQCCPWLHADEEDQINNDGRNDQKKCVVLQIRVYFYRTQLGVVHEGEDECVLDSPVSPETQLGQADCRHDQVHCKLERSAQYFVALGLVLKDVVVFFV